MPKTIYNKIADFKKISLAAIGIAGIIMYAQTCHAEQFDYEKEKLLQSDKVMTETDKPKSNKWIKYRNNKAVFSANIGTKKNPNYEIVVSDADGSNQEIFTHHPFSDRFPLWAGDNEIAFERIGKDGKKDIQAYYILNIGTKKFKLIKLDEYNKLKEANK